VPENDYYTWAEYKAGVMKLLPIEANRIGIGTTATDYRESLIRQAVIDLQRVIPSFRVNHETIYNVNDLVREGLAMRGTKPPQSTFRDLSIFRITSEDGEESCDARYHAIAHSWKDRFQLINGELPVNDGDARYCIDPSGYTFYVYPMNEEECWMVSFFWDGQKIDFKDDEQVPFSEASMLAVSYFVKAHSTLEAEDNVQGKTDWKAEYEKQKPKLYLDSKDQGGI
jgi:hypothetical protein